MHVYPEATDKMNVKEVWQAGKWLTDAPDDVLTPMIRRKADFKAFYVNELVQCRDGRWFIPERFIIFEGVQWALGRFVDPSAVNCCPRVLVNTLLIQASATTDRPESPSCARCL